MSGRPASCDVPGDVSYVVLIRAAAGGPSRGRHPEFALAAPGVFAFG
jgi:hypothetical protein